jgi:ankyrin repeat protein
MQIYESPPQVITDFTCDRIPNRGAFEPISSMAQGPALTFSAPSHLWTTDSILDVAVVAKKKREAQSNLHDFGNLISFILWQGKAATEGAFLKDPSLFKSRNSEGANPAMIAAAEGPPALVDFMLKHGVGLRDRTRDGGDLLSCAVRYDGADMLDHVVKLGFPVDRRLPKTNVTPLMEAVAGTCQGSVTWLLVHGANPNVHNVNHGTPLSLAIANTHVQSEAIFDQLIAAKADIHYRFPDGRNMLDFAIEKGDIHSLEKLVDMGLNVNDQMPGSKTTPLMFAAWIGAGGLAKYLISKGAKKTDAVDSKGLTVFDYAKKSSTLHTDRFFREQAGLE